MKFITKRFLVAALAAVMVLGLTGASEVSAAASPRLSAKSKTLTVGQSYTVKLLNNKKSVKWSASNKNIKIVSKNRKQAKVKAVKKGTSFLQAKVGKKVYRCKMTVKEKASKQKAENGIRYELHRTDNGVVGIFTNTNGYDASVVLEIKFYDENGRVVKTSYSNNYCLGKGETYADEFNAGTQNFSSYKLTEVIANKSYYTSYASKIKVSNVDFTSDDYYWYASVENKSGKTLDYVNVSCVIYGENNKIIGCEDYYVYGNNSSSGMKKNDSVRQQFIKWGSRFDDMTKCKLYVNYAYGR